jgi:modulator of FtsH protease HflC
MNAIWETHKLSILAFAALVIAALSTVVIVDETKQGVVIRTGEPVRVINQFQPDEPFGGTGAGVAFRVPLLERVQMVDRRILDLDMERQLVLSNDQQRLQVDAYARYRIFDPVLMVERAGNEAQLNSQLVALFAPVLRQELGRRPFASLINAERGTAMLNIRDSLDELARSYGAQVLDVRIKRADLPEGAPLDAAFIRMETDRQEVAASIRAAGDRDAQITRADAEAEAARISAEAFGKDPQFYDFYRAMQSYRTTFQTGEGETSIILSDENDYLRQFRGG